MVLVKLMFIQVLGEFQLVLGDFYLGLGVFTFLCMRLCMHQNWIWVHLN